MGHRDWYWRWLDGLADAGHGALAREIRRFHADSRAELHDRLDAAAPGLVAAARALGDERVELVLRVTHMKSRVMKRGEAATALADAIDLVEFAHRPATRDMVEAVCSIDVLVRCYHLIDEVGYAEERVAACEQALAGMEPHARCFECIWDSYVCALLDARRFEQVVDAVARYRALARSAELDDREMCATNLASALSALGRHEEALREMTALRAREADLDESDVLLEALLLARLGRADESLALLAELDDAPLAPYDGCGWARCLLALADRCGRNPTDADMDRVWAAHALACHQGHDYYAAFLAHAAGALALHRDDRESVARALALAEPLTARLRRPERLQNKLVRLRRAL